MQHLNTKADYEYVKNNEVTGWETAFKQLLEGRFIVGDDGNITEDDNAKIFRLGYTSTEVAEAIDFSGLTDTELAFYKSHPLIWEQDDSGNWAEIDGWQDTVAAAELVAAQTAKLAEIQAYKTSIVFGGVAVEIDGVDVTFSTDTEARLSYNEYYQELLLDPTYTVAAWKASGSTYVEMSADVFAALKTAVKHLRIQAFATQEILNTQVKALVSVEDVSAFNVHNAWADANS